MGHTFKPCISFFDLASFSNFFSNLAPLFSNLADLFFLTLAVCPTGPAGVELTASLKWGGGFPRFWMVAGFGRSSGEVLVWVSSIHPIYGIYPTLSYFAHLSHPFSSCLILSSPLSSYFIQSHPTSSHLIVSIQSIVTYPILSCRVLIYLIYLRHFSYLTNLIHLINEPIT